MRGPSMQPPGPDIRDPRNHPDLADAPQPDEAEAASDEESSDDPYAEQLRRAIARQRRRRFVERLLYRKDALGRTVPDRRKWVLLTTGGLLFLLVPLFASVQWATGPAAHTPSPEEEGVADTSALPQAGASPPAAPSGGPAPQAGRDLPLVALPEPLGAALPPPPPAPPSPPGAAPPPAQPAAIVPPFEEAGIVQDALAAGASPQVRSLTLHAPPPPPVLVHRTPPPPPPEPGLPVVLHEAPLPWAPAPGTAAPSSSPGSPASPGPFPPPSAPLPSGGPGALWAASAMAPEASPGAGSSREAPPTLTLAAPAQQTRPPLALAGTPSPPAPGGLSAHPTGDSAAAGRRSAGVTPAAPPIVQAAPTGGPGAAAAPASMTLIATAPRGRDQAPAPLLLASQGQAAPSSQGSPAGVTLATATSAPATPPIVQAAPTGGPGAAAAPASMTLIATAPRGRDQAPAPLLLASQGQAAPSSQGSPAGVTLATATSAPAAPPMTLSGQTAGAGGNTPPPVTLAAAQAGQEKPALILQSVGGTAPPLLSQAPSAAQGSGFTLSGTQPGAGGLSFAAPSTAPQSPQAPARSPYRIGAQLKGKLETRVLLPLLGGGQGERTMPAVAKTSDGTVWLGEATPGAGRLVQIQFRQAVLADGQAISVSAVAVSPDGTVGLAAKIHEQPPALAQDLLRSAISGVSDYVQALKEAQSVVMTPDGFIATEKQVPDLQWFLAGKVAEAFGLPVQPGQSVVRLAEVPKETELFVLVIGER